MYDQLVLHYGQTIVIIDPKVAVCSCIIGRSFNAHIATLSLVHAHIDELTHIPGILYAYTLTSLY